MSIFVQAMKAISTAPTRRRLWEDGQQAQRVSYHAVGANSTTIRIATGGFPEEWVATCIRERPVEIDPIPEPAAPFYWRDAERVADARGLSRRQG